MSLIGRALRNNWSSPRTAVKTVSDSGVDMLEEIKLKLFTPMMTANLKAKGPVLFASKRMVEARRGRLILNAQNSSSNYH